MSNLVEPFAQAILNGVLVGFGYALVAASFIFIYGPVKFFHLSHAAIYTIGAYSTYYFNVTVQLPFALSIAFAVGTTALIGALLHICLYRPLTRRGVDSLGLLLTSFAIYLVLENTISLTFGDGVRQLSFGTLSGVYSAFQMAIAKVQLLPALAALILIPILAVIIHQTTVGRIYKAMVDDLALAHSYGLVSPWAITIVFAVGSGICALAGALVAVDTNLQPRMGFPVLVVAVAAGFIGGTRNIAGSAAAALGLGILQHIIVFASSPRWETTIIFAILGLVILLQADRHTASP